MQKFRNSFKQINCCSMMTTFIIIVFFCSVVHRFVKDNFSLDMSDGLIKRLYLGFSKKL